MRLTGILVLSLGMLPAILGKQQAGGLQHDPLVSQLTAIAQDFERRARLADSAVALARPVIVVDTPPQISMYKSGPNTIHTSRWEELMPDVQDICRRWATYTGDTTGRQLFEDMFHRFFFVHELAHWLQRQAKDTTGDAYQFELEANRVTVAYWREKDSVYLSALLARFQRIRDRLPSPVPDGQDAEQYFNANRSRLGSNPDVYGWFQTRMVVQAGSERPFLMFSETVRGLSVHTKNPVRLIRSVEPGEGWVWCYVDATAPGELKGATFVPFPR